MPLVQVELNSPPSDAISALRFAPTSLRLLVASWDKKVYLYDTSSSGGVLVRTFEHRAPVLDVCFGESDEDAYTTGLDWDVRHVNLATGEQTVLSSHSAGVKSLAYSHAHKLLVSASWDSSLHLHHPSHPPASVSLPAKPFSISFSASKLVVAMASRVLHIYDLEHLVSALSSLPSNNGGIDSMSVAVPIEVEPWQRRESSLRFMTRAVACMPNDAGYASSSIEGRVAVEWFDPSPESQGRKYAFKCHRQPSSEGIDVVYPVNALAFHPGHGTFASGGGDGLVLLWDGVAKRRIRQYQKYGSSVAALSFSGDGKYLAVGISPGFEDGKEGTGEGSVKVFIRELGETEAKGKGSK
ncbi:MAG: hypothetical protein LQ342_004953 [Letrouitia transgressa]|nr:MAG: hypothetical protein LQ342_004953 [Letrouitia transgressa]